MNKEEILKITKKKTIDKLNSVDQKIINISLILDKLPTKINELFETIKIITDQEFPNFDKYLSIEKYCQIYLLKEINKKTLESISISKEDIENILLIQKSNIKINLTKSLKNKTKQYCQSVLDLIKTKQELEVYINYLLKENYINTYKIVTPKISFKMLEIAGSFQRLAKFSASTIQMLGSEKSFFKALKYNKKTPKYGIIYNHPIVVETKTQNKGKIARSLAAIISLAIKADIQGKDITKYLNEKIKKRLSEIK